MCNLSANELAVSDGVISRNEQWCPICQQPIPAGSEVRFEVVSVEEELFDVWTHPSCDMHGF